MVADVAGSVVEPLAAAPGIAYIGTMFSTKHKAVEGRPSRLVGASGMKDVGGADRRRQLLTVAAALGQVVLPFALSPRFDDDGPPNVLQPVPATFAVWLPIFATSLLHSGFQAMPGRADDPVLRTVGGPASVAYAATALWAPLVRTRRYWSAQGALFVIAGAAEVARRRIAVAQESGALTPDVRLAVAPPIGMLAAWGAVASAVNLGAMLVGEGPVRQGRPAQVTGAVLTMVTSAIAVTAAKTSAGGATTFVGRTYLATVAWALAGVIAGQRRRSPLVAIAAAGGLPPVAAALTKGISR